MVNFVSAEMGHVAKMLYALVRRCLQSLLLAVLCSCAAAPPGLTAVTLTLPEAVVSTAVSSRGRFLAAASEDHRIDVVDVAERRIIRTLVSHAYSISRLKLSDAGDWLLCEGGTGLFNSMSRFEAWSLADGRQVLPKDCRARAGDLSPASPVVLLSTGHGMEMIALPTGRAERAPFPENWHDPTFVDFSSDRSCIVCDAWVKAEPDLGRVALLDSRRFGIESTFCLNGRQFVGASGRDTLIALAKDGSDGSDTFYDLRTEKTLLRTGRTGDEVENAAIFGAGRFLFTLQQEARVWSVQRHMALLSIKVDSPEKFRFSCQGSFLAASQGGYEVTVFSFGNGM